MIRGTAALPGQVFAASCQLQLPAASKRLLPAASKQTHGRCRPCVCHVLGTCPACQNTRWPRYRPENLVLAASFQYTAPTLQLYTSAARQTGPRTYVSLCWPHNRDSTYLASSHRSRHHHGAGTSIPSASIRLYQTTTTKPSPSMRRRSALASLTPSRPAASPNTRPVPVPVPCHPLPTASVEIKTSNLFSPSFRLVRLSRPSPTLIVLTRTQPHPPRKSHCLASIQCSGQ